MRRYELKYVVPMVSHKEVIAQIMMHPASFSKAFPDRQVNNIYFDTPDFHCFFQNIEGAPRRDKMRLRWYGGDTLPTAESILEIKHKDRELGWKTSIPMDAGGIDSQEDLLHLVRAAGIYKSEFLPVLHNTYLRSYFISADGFFRITVDRAQTYGVPLSGCDPLSISDYPVVVELKFDENHFGLSRFITDYLVFRLSKNSKYVTGIQSLYFS